MITLPSRAAPGLYRKGDQFRQAQVLVHEIDVSDVVQIQDCAQVLRCLKFESGSVVGGEHDLFAAESDFLTQQ